MLRFLRAGLKLGHKKFKQAKRPKVSNQERERE